MAKRPTSKPKTINVSTVDVPPAKPLDMSCVQSARSSNASLFLISTTLRTEFIINFLFSHFQCQNSATNVVSLVYFAFFTPALESCLLLMILALQLVISMILQKAHGRGFISRETITYGF
ncbi:hypothetical protein GmHk_04G009784 [Glycine max]|nr:hypothetical protein GmHk_04G009784 [Glycine max]